MKRTYRHRLSILCISIGLFFIGLKTSSAQSYPSLPTDSEALSMLLLEIPIQETTLNSLVAGPVFEVMYRKVSMYKHVVEMLEDGQKLEPSLNSAFQEFAVDKNGQTADYDEFLSLPPNTSSFGDVAFDSLIEFLTN